jgi:hypothetical protein
MLVACACCYIYSNSPFVTAYTAWIANNPNQHGISSVGALNFLYSNDLWYSQISPMVFPFRIYLLDRLRVVRRLSLSEDFRKQMSA